MVDLAHVYVALFAIGSTTFVWLGYEVRRQRNARGAGPLGLILIALTLWTCCYTVVWSVSAMEAQVFWLKMTFTANALLSPAVLAFALAITGMGSWRTPGRILLLAAPAVASFALVWLSPTPLLFGTFSRQAVGDFTHFSPGQGPVFLPLVLLLYAPTIVSLAILARGCVVCSGVRRTQTAIVLVGILVPVVVSVIGDTTGFALPGGADPVPIALVLSAALFFVALKRGLLLDLVSLARNLVVESMNDGVIVFDDHERVVDTNPSAARLVGMTFTESLGATAEKVLGRFDGAASSLQPVTAAHTTLVSAPANGDRQYADLSVTPLLARPGNPSGSLVTLHDVTEAKRSEQRLQAVNAQLEEQLREVRRLQDELREQAVRDPLTTLYNRRFFEDDIVREIARAERSAIPIGFLMIDIDFFKQVNDTYSHSAGDTALKAVSEILLDEARAGDIVCRYGGDELVVVLLGCGTDAAFARAEEIRQKIAAAPLRFGTLEFSITASVGVASFPTDGTTCASAVAAADRALYLAKESGRNRTVISSAP